MNQETIHQIQALRYNSKEGGTLTTASLLGYQAWDFTDDKFTFLLNDLQANILKAHGQESALLIFFKLRKKGKASLKTLKDWLQNELDITSALQQFQYFSPEHSGNGVYLLDNMKGNQKNIFCFYLGRSGYDFFYGKKEAGQYWEDSAFEDGRLQRLIDSLYKKNEVTDSAVNETIVEFARNRMEELKKKREGLRGPSLGDVDNHDITKKLNEIENFIKNLENEHGPNGQGAIPRNSQPAKHKRVEDKFDAMLLVAGKKGAQDVLNLKKKIEIFGEDVMIIEAKLNPEGISGKSKDWFGFRDGIANPRFFPSKSRQYKEGFEKPANLDQVLRPCISSGIDACGSFLAFMKVKQNTDLFEETCKALAIGSVGNDEDWNRLYDEEKKVRLDLAAASIVGVHKDGTPLTLSTEPNGNHRQVYDYSNDRLGFKCPFHAHARKANPREGEEYRRVVRRGMLYEAGYEKGILFMSFQRDLEDQFEHLMKKWLFGYNYKSNPFGKDPLLSTDGKYRTYLKEWGNGNSGRISIPIEIRKAGSLATLEWGQYFFAPSISFIKKTLPRKIEQVIQSE